ncbi:MAG: formate/nitrite transporter family protein [Clostridiales bacterium]|nr:formate/nitrite transporter family protein [Clostridiales bacterium]
MLSSKEITRKWEGIANTKAALPAGRCFLLAILAGMYIALGGLGATLIQASAGAAIGKLLGACVFPTGLILVVMAGGELFTGNCLMAGPVLMGKCKAKGMLRNWLLVYFGNMVGGLLVAIIATAGGVLSSGGDAAVQLAMTIAKNKCQISFVDALLKGIGCNMLVSGAVFMAIGADSAGSKGLCCFFPVMLFVLCGMEHCVANMYYVPTAMLMKIMPRYRVDGAGITFLGYFVTNLIPVTIGNILGGAGLAAAYAGIHREN